MRYGKNFKRIICLERAEWALDSIWFLPDEKLLMWAFWPGTIKKFSPFLLSAFVFDDGNGFDGDGVKPCLFVLFCWSSITRM